jgi:hypothetical protein
MPREIKKRPAGNLILSRIVICTGWHVDRANDRDSIEIIEEFSALMVAKLPLAIGSATPLYVVTFWEGRPTSECPVLRITCPGGFESAVVLPRLNERRTSQVQVNSLIGFQFHQRGNHNIAVNLGQQSMSKTLRVNVLKGG